mgnify:FL=1
MCKLGQELGKEIEEHRKEQPEFIALLNKKMEKHLRSKVGGRKAKANTRDREYEVELLDCNQEDLW